MDSVAATTEQGAEAESPSEVASPGATPTRVRVAHAPTAPVFESSPTEPAPGTAQAPERGERKVNEGAVPSAPSWGAGAEAETALMVNPTPPAPAAASAPAAPSDSAAPLPPEAPPAAGSAAPTNPAGRPTSADDIAAVPAGMTLDAAEASAGAGETPSALPPNLLARMKNDPSHAPEHLVLAAVDKFGPEAALWMARTRAAHPYVPDHVWVPVIRTRFVRLSRYSGAAAGAAGAVGAVFDVGVLAWNQARMVLHIAAALGYDPTHPDRAAELLVIRGLQTKLDAARTAVEVARRQQEPSALAQHLPERVRNFGSGAGRAYTELAWQLARMAGLAAAKKMAMKFVPFAGVPLGAIANSSATKKLAQDAVNYYSAHRQPLALPPAPE